MDDAIDAAREAFMAVSCGLIVQPARLAVPDGSTLIMFAHGTESDRVVKVVSIRPGSSELGIPSLQVIVLCLDQTTRSGAAVAVRSAASRAARCRLLPLNSPVKSTCAGTKTSLGLRHRNIAPCAFTR